MQGGPPEPTVPFRPGERYEIRRLSEGDGCVLLDACGDAALVIPDLAGRVWTVGASWEWSVSRHRLRWAIVIRSGESQREALRVSPGPGLVAYRMSAEGRPVCTLRQNPFTHVWRLRRRSQTLARIEVEPGFYGARATDRSVGCIDVRAALPSGVLGPASIVAAMLCIRGEEGYTKIGEMVVRSE